MVTLEDKWIGERLVKAGVITEQQRKDVLVIQDEPVNSHIRFGDIATREGFCQREEIESISGFLGDLLVEKGLLTEEQLEELLRLQKNMRDGGLYAPNLGELAAMHEICDKKDIEATIVFNRSGARKNLNLPEESSDW
jgi:hypothetical protein